MQDTHSKRMRKVRWFDVLRRLRGLRDDERGTMLLLPAVLSFCAVVIVVAYMNAAQATQTKLRMQNAADAAAHASAAWQARGMNLMQHLNNFHYLGNSAFYLAETVACCACPIQPVVYGVNVACDACKAALIAGPACTACAIAAFAVRLVLYGACTLCVPIDNAQYQFAEIIHETQAIIAGKWALTSFVAASHVAYLNGADPLVDSLGDYINDGALASLNSMVTLAGAPIDFSHIPLTEDGSPERGALGDLMVNMAGLLGGAQLYAIPVMDQWLYENMIDQFTTPPDELDKSHYLGLLKIEDDQAFPWLNEADAAKACAEVSPHDPFAEGSYGPLGNVGYDDEDHADFDDGNDDLGWQDAYWAGYPSYMTWMVMKTRQTGGLAGLAQRPAQVVGEEYFDEEAGEWRTIGAVVQPLWRYLSPADNMPGFAVSSQMSLASAQADGTVIHFTGEPRASATAHLVPVHLFRRSMEVMGVKH